MISNAACCLTSNTVEMPPNTQSSPILAILAMVIGIGVFFLLSIVGLVLICLWLRKPKQKESSEAPNEHPRALNAIYEDPDTLLADNVQLSVLQSRDVITTENVAYSTKLQIFQDENKDTEYYSDVNAIK